MVGFRIVALLACIAAVGSDFHRVTPREPRQPPATVQRQPPKSSDTTRGGIKPNIRVESTLVLIPVTVVDPMYRFVVGLKKEDFHLFEDQLEQTILHVSVEDAPVSIGVIVDCSGSMQGKLEQSHRAVMEFLNAANSNDEFFLLLFSDHSELAVDFTNSREELTNGLSKARAEGSTALLDALYLALHRIRFGSAPRKALLLISDGGENSSRYTEREVKGFAEESDAQVFAIGIYKRVPSNPEDREAFSGRTLMTRLAEITGGFQYPVQDVNELPQMATNIGRMLRSQYVLAYTPTNHARDGKYRRVTVKVAQPIGRPALRAYWRTGYYAPNSIH
jgi:VWFA-related protein